MARSKQVARDRNLPAGPDQDALARIPGLNRRNGPALPQGDGPLTANGARRAAGAAGNDFVSDMVGGRREGPRGGNGVQINADVATGGNGGQSSLQVSGNLQVGGLQIGGNLRVGGGRGANGGGSGGNGAGNGPANGARANGPSPESAPRANETAARGPAGPTTGGGGGNGGAPGAPAGANGMGGGNGGAPDDVLAVGGFQMRTAGGTAGGGSNAPAAPSGAGGPPAGGGAGAPGGGGSAGGGAGRGGARGGGGNGRGGRGGLSVSVSGGGISASISQDGASVSAGNVSAAVSGSGASVSAGGNTASVSADGASVSTPNVSGSVSSQGASVSAQGSGGSASVAVAGGGGAAAVTVGGGSAETAAPTTAAGTSRAGGTTGVGTAARTGTGGSSGNAAGGSRAPRGGTSGGGGGAQGGGGRAGGGGGGGASQAPAAPVQVGNSDSAQGAMNEFLGSSPTQQVKMWTSVGGAVDAGIQKDAQSIQDAAPELHATMGGGGQEPEADDRKTEVKAGQGKIDDKKVSPDAPKLKAEPTVVPPAPKVSGARAMSGITAETPIEQKQARAAETIAAMPTTMDGVPTSPGPAPKVPLAGDADPAKAEANRADADAQVQQGASDLRAAVENGRGPDAVQPKVFDEANKVRKLVDAKVDATKPVDPLQKYMQLGPPADVEGAIDEQQQAVMDAAMGEARGKIDEAVSTRDADSRREIDNANAEAERMRADAESSQQDAVGRARGEITDAREETLREQERAVAELNSEATSKQSQEVAAIHARVAQDEAKIDDAYSKAESDVEKQIQEGEKDAEEEKRKAEEASKKRSWWDRVKDAVASAFEALTDAINGILNAVRDAVKGILDGVKKLATDLIDAASKWITDKLKAFGDWLKSAVTALLGSVFPELAKALNEAIDFLVNEACQAVEQLANQLKEGIAALCDKIAGALDAIIGAFQAAVSFAMTLAEAAMTGNWAKVGQIILEGILKLAGIPPEEFYAVIGKAEGTIGKIVENPGGFLGNCLDAVGQGFGQFSDNFLDHLQNGFLSWMTGTMGEAGIQMPATLDLAGIFDLVIQVTGLTKDHLREKAVEHLGEENVERFEFVWGFVESALEGGWGGLWEHVEGYLGGLWDDVIGTIQNFLMEKIIKSAVLKIASMFNPVGAIVQAIMTAWNLYEFLRDQIQRIFGVVRAVVDSISDIANGNIGGAADMIENALGNLVPVAIDLLAKLLGLGGLGAKIKEVVGGVRAKIDQAIDKMIEKVKGLFKGGGKGKDKDEEPAAADPAAAAGEQAPDRAQEGATPNGLFTFESGSLLGRDPTLGAVSFKITGTGRVKNDKGELTEGQINSAKADAVQAATSAVGKAVNANGVTGVSGQLGVLSDQAKVSAARNVSGLGLTLDALTISGIVLPPEVQQALDQRAASNIVDEPLGFQAGGENHRLWIAAQGNNVVAMVASTPMSVKDRIEGWRAILREKTPEERRAAGSAIGRAIALERAVASVAADVKAGTKTQQDLDIKKGELAGALGELFNVLPEHAAAEALDPELTLTGNNFKNFERQFLAIANQVGMANPQAEAQRVWLQVVRGLLASQETVARADKDPATQRTDLENKAFQDVLKTFDPVVAALSPAMEKLTAGQDTWSFWSGRPAMAMAIRSGGVALEGSALGKVFSDISLRATPSIQLWAALSRAYANFAAENMEKRTYLGFVGTGSSTNQSVFNKIEQPAFNVAAESIGFTPRLTFFACAVKLTDQNTPDDRFVAVPGRPGTYGQGDRGSMVSLAESKNKERVEEFERLLAAGATKDQAADAVGPNWVKGSPLPGNSQRVANGAVDVAASPPGLTPPAVVPGVGNGQGQVPARSVGAQDADRKGQLEQPVPVPTNQSGRPGTSSGQGGGNGEVQNTSGVGFGHDNSVSSQTGGVNNVQTSKTAVSKYAVSDAPAGWRERVVRSVPSETVNADDPGHTYHILDDGSVVSESRPMLVDARTSDKTKKRVGFSAQARKKTPEDTLRTSGEMSSEEVDLMKGALKKNPRSEEKLQADGTTKAVAKPELTDATGKKISNGENADGTTRAAMTEKEKAALLKGHGVLAKDNKEGADMRKVIPNASVGSYFSKDADVGSRKGKTGGSVALTRNTEGKNAEDTVATLGLDYTDSSIANRPTAPGYKKKKAISPFAQKDSATGEVTLADDVDKNGLHYIDFKMTKEMEKSAGVLMSQGLIDQAKTSADPQVAAMGTKAIGREKEAREDAYAGTGATSSNALRRKHGPKAGEEFEPDLNQELMLKGGFELQTGAQMKRRGDEAGKDKVIATLVEKADKDGKIVKEWELDENLDRNERGQYKNRTDKAESDHRATKKQAGEDDTAHKTRLQARDATIVDQQKEDMAAAGTNGNPFEPGTAEFKSYNRKAKEKAKAKADSAEVKPVAPNGDVAAAPPVAEKKAPAAEAPPAPVAAAETEAKDQVKKGSSKGAPDTEAAPPKQVEAVAKNDAKTPAEAVEKLLSPAAKVKPPKESKPPKDFPEPANDTVQGNGSTQGASTTTDGSTRKVAPNPGLRKEHEGTGVEYAEMKGEAFVKGEGDAADIDPNDVKQGSLGDCYLLGGMAAVSRANPEHIRKLIKDNGDGTYDVTLYIKDNAWSSKGTAKVVTVDSKFPSGDKGLSAKYSKAGDKGPKGPELWCMLIEKAWAVHKGTYTGIEGGKVNDDGKFAGAIALLTNLREGYYTPASIGDKQLAQMIADALSQKKPVACDSKNLDKEPPDLKAAADAAGVVGNHAYAPKSVDLAAMTIELQNPWGSSHVSGLKIADFKRFYRGLRIGS